MTDDDRNKRTRELNSKTGHGGPTVARVIHVGMRVGGGLSESVADWAAVEGFQEASTRTIEPIAARNRESVTQTGL